MCNDRKIEAPIDDSTFLHMLMLGNKVVGAYDVFKKYSDYQDSQDIGEQELSDVKLSFHAIIIIDTVSFADEWNLYFKHERFPNKRIEDFKICVQPVSKLLNAEYPNLRTFRNQFLAHPFRDNDLNSIWFDPRLNALNMPITEFDLKLLVGAIDYLTDKIYEYYITEINAFKKLIQTKRESHILVSKPERTAEDIKTAFKKADENLKEFHR